jgi:hypothetical protein
MGGGRLGPNHGCPKGKGEFRFPERPNHDLGGTRPRLTGLLPRGEPREERLKEAAYRVADAKGFATSSCLSSSVERPHVGIHSLCIPLTRVTAASPALRSAAARSFPMVFDVYPSVVLIEEFVPLELY